MNCVHYLIYLLYTYFCSIFLWYLQDIDKANPSKKKKIVLYVLCKVNIHFDCECVHKSDPWM